MLILAYNNLSIISSRNARFFILKDHHQALKYMVFNIRQYECGCSEIYEISQIFINFYKTFTALKCIHFIFHIYIGGYYIVFLLFPKLYWLVLTSIFLNIQLPGKWILKQIRTSNSLQIFYKTKLHHCWRHNYFAVQTPHLPTVFFHLCITECIPAW
jgi:hypothetical protein